MTDAHPDLAAIKDGHWLARGEWVAEYCAEQPGEPEPLFRVQPEANAATVARIHNGLLAEVEQLRKATAAARTSLQVLRWMIEEGGHNSIELREGCLATDAILRAARTPDGA